MCLLIDDRERPRPGQSSNRDILEQLKLYRDIEHVVMRLDSADCRFTGNGENGECFVGCERKRLSDLINSMKDRRLSGRQLREMINEHDYVFLVVEGMWRPGRDGEIEEYVSKQAGWRPVYHRSDKFAVNYRQVAAYLTTLTLLGCVNVIRTSSAWETAAWYVALWHWFNEKEWNEHKSHDQVYVNRGAVEGKRARLNGLRSRTAPSELRMMLMQLPGLDEKAKAAEQHFGSIRAMAAGTVRDWVEVKGVGKKLAERYVEIVRKDVRGNQ